jgi:soluble lytic murein transglycosylase-like protein
MYRTKILLLAGLALAHVSGVSPEPEPAPEPIVVVAAAPAGASPHAERREAHQWGLWVEAVKDETLIRDAELAETVALAIEDAASEFDVNPWMLASLIRIESSGRPEVVSHAGAIGLTQILPGTAEEITDKLQLAEYDLTDPYTNVRMGAFYVAGLLERFDGDESVALAAYNYGPTTIARMLRNDEDLPTVYAGKILIRLASK